MDDSPPRLASRVPSWLATSAAYAWRILLVGVLLWALGHALGWVSAVAIPFALAFFLASTLDPLVNKLDDWGLPRGLGAAISLGAVLCGLGLAVGLIGYRASQDMSSATVTLQDGWSRLFEDVAGVVPGVEEERLRVLADDAVGSMTNYVRENTSSVIDGASTAGVVLTGVGFALFFAFYLLKDGRELADAVARQLHGHRRTFAERVGRVAWAKTGAYMRGTTVVASVNACLTGVVMWIVGVPMIGPVMILTFLGSYIPFAGPIVAGVVTALIALATQGPTAALILIGASMAIQAIEGNLLQPLVLGSAVKVHPMVVLLAVGIGAGLGGVIGAFLAVPVAASAVALVGETREAKREWDRMTGRHPKVEVAPDASRPMNRLPIGLGPELLDDPAE